MAVQTSIQWYRGQRKVFTITYAGGSINTAGWSLGFFVKRDWNDAAHVVRATSEAGDITNDGAGTFTLTLTSDMSRQRPFRYKFSFERTDPGSEDVLAVGDALCEESYRA